MSNRDMTKEQLLDEVEKLRSRVAKLEGTVSTGNQVERNIQLSEDRFQSLVETSSDWIWEVDKNGIYTYVNPQVQNVLGYSANEILGKSLFDFISPDEIERIQKIFIEVIENKKQISGLEKRCLHKSGRLITLEVSAVPVLSSNDELLGYRGINRDITDRKQVEEELRKSEKQYRFLFDTMEQGVVYQDADGKITLANTMAERILGLTIDQMQGRESVDPRWRAIHEDGSDFPGHTHPSIVALKTGKNSLNKTMGVFNPQKKDFTWIKINAIPQFMQGKKKPYSRIRLFCFSLRAFKISSSRYLMSPG